MEYIWNIYMEYIWNHRYMESKPIPQHQQSNIKFMKCHSADISISFAVNDFSRYNTHEILSSRPWI